MQSKAATVAEYVKELPPEKRGVIKVVRRAILENLGPDFEEGMQYGMIGYYVPHRVYPAGYHTDPKQPLPFAALAAQKNYFAVYLMCQYANPAEEKWFKEAWGKTGKKLDMGKCCVRFKKLEDAALEVIGEAIGRVSAKQFIAEYEKALASRKASAPKKTSAKKTPKKRP